MRILLKWCQRYFPIDTLIHLNTSLLNIELVFQNKILPHYLTTHTHKVSQTKRDHSPASTNEISRRFLLEQTRMIKLWAKPIIWHTIIHNQRVEIHMKARQLVIHPLARPIEKVIEDKSIKRNNEKKIDKIIFGKLVRIFFTSGSFSK